MKSESLIINICDLEGTLGAFLDIDLKGNPQELGLKIEGVGFTDLFRIQARLINDGDCIDVKAKIAMGIRLECDRCLGEFSYSLEREFHLDYYRGRPKVCGGELELRCGDFEKVYYRGGEIDLRDEIRNEIILGVPMRPLCRSDCLGLCPACGQNLNERKCTCQRDEIDPRLAKLKEFLGKPRIDTNEHQ